MDNHVVTDYHPWIDANSGVNDAMFSDFRVVADVDVLVDLRVVAHFGVMPDIGMASEVDLLPELGRKEIG